MTHPIISRFFEVVTRPHLAHGGPALPSIYARPSSQWASQGRRSSDRRARLNAQPHILVIQMSELKVIPIPIAPMGMINAFLVVGPNGKILVDAGLKGSEDKITKVLHKQGLGFEDIDAIVITHAHGDHAGNAHKLRELTKAPLIAHEAALGGKNPSHSKERPRKCVRYSQRMRTSPT